MMDECIFCTKYEKKEGIIYEDEYFYSQFDLFPISVGHSEIISKRHAVSLCDLTLDEWNYLKLAIKNTINLIEGSNLEEIYLKFLRNPTNNSSKEFLKNVVESPFIHARSEAYNHGVNDGKAAGRTIDHFHWHIIPRYHGDVSNPRGGIR